MVTDIDPKERLKDKKRLLTEKKKEYETEILKQKVISSDIRKLMDEVNTVKSKQRASGRIIDRLYKDIDNLKRDIKHLTPRDPDISDHAIVRYLERVQGINLEDLKETILNDEVKILMNSGAKEAVIDGATYVFRDHTVITIIK